MVIAARLHGRSISVDAEDASLQIAEAQLRLGREWPTTYTIEVEGPTRSGAIEYLTLPVPRLPLVYRHNWRRAARWYELEALRRYDNGVVDYGLLSWQMSLLHARNLRWRVELLDAGRKVIGERFDRTVERYAGMSFQKWMEASAAKILESAA